MENSERRQILDIFRKWICEQKSDRYRMYLAGEQGEKIVLETDYCRGEIAFYPQEIVELCVVSKKDDQNVFYLHFQLNTLEYAKERFQEMREAIESMAEKPPTKILLSCSCGITTYYFMDKLNQTAKLLNLDYVFFAVPYTNLYSEGGQYDAIFLAPQIAYMCEAVRKTLPNVCVEAIPPKLFAAYDVRQFYELLEKTLQKERITESFLNRHRRCLMIIDWNAGCWPLRWSAEKKASFAARSGCMPRKARCFIRRKSSRGVFVWMIFLIFVILLLPGIRISAQ